MASSVATALKKPNIVATQTAKPDTIVKMHRVFNTTLPT